MQTLNTEPLTQILGCDLFFFVELVALLGPFWGNPVTMWADMQHDHNRGNIILKSACGCVSALRSDQGIMEVVVDTQKIPG